MTLRRGHRAFALLAAGAITIAACGNDDGGDSSGVLGSTTAAPAATEAPATTAAPATTGAPDGGGDTGGGGLADDSIHGDGAEFWESVYDAQPGKADESLEPVLITMTNVEGSPAGSFPDIREGAEAAVKEINEHLGGLNGRPIELEVCVNGLDPNEATNCANEVADAQPTLHIQGINFFNPLMWPVFLGAGIPVLETVPIFISDFDTAGILSTEGGCANAFPGAAMFAAEVLGNDKVAVIHSDTGPGFECYQDTQVRFYQHYVDTGVLGDFRGFPDASGDPSDNDAVAQGVIEYLSDAENGSIFFGIQSSDCNEILSALAAAGNTNTIVASGSCRDTSVEANPASHGAYFSSASKIPYRPDLWTEWETKTTDARTAAFEARPNKDAPESAFMETAYDVMMSAWVQLSLFDAAGGDLNDAAAVFELFSSQDNLYRHNGPPVNCSNNGSEFESICNTLHNFYLWDGTTFEYGPLGPDYLDVAPLHAAVAETNPRQS